MQNANEKYNMTNPTKRQVKSRFFGDLVLQILFQMFLCEWNVLITCETRAMLTKNKKARQFHLLKDICKSHTMELIL